MTGTPTPGSNQQPATSPPPVDPHGQNDGRTPRDHPAADQGTGGGVIAHLVDRVVLIDVEQLAMAVAVVAPFTVISVLKLREQQREHTGLMAWWAADGPRISGDLSVTVLLTLAGAAFLWAAWSHLRWRIRRRHLVDVEQPPTEGTPES